MSDEIQAAPSSDQTLDDLLAQYIAGEEAGHVPDRQQLLIQHPQFAADLCEFFANRDQMQRLAQPLRGDAEVSRGGPPLGKVRYFGDYELLEEVAAGGMGIIYKARQRSLNRIVAVKMILKGTLARDEDVKRFRVEAEAAANLQHPAIVAIHEVGLHEGQHYFSMDYVEGHSLAELPREQPLPARQAAEYVRDAAEAVHYAHQQGTLHRDLKPSNILIDRQGRVRITDFGLAKRIEGNSDLTLTGQILGTPSYMPPEQATSKRALVAAASDVYSLGAVLYELLTGRPPFRGESPAETLRQVEALDPISPRLLSPAVPRDLETVCLKCLEKEPHKRYGTAQLLAADLGRYLRGEPILARPISRPARAWRWCRRRPVHALLAAALLLLISGGVAAGFWYQAIEGDRQRRALAESARFEHEVELALHEAESLGKRAESMREDPAHWQALLAAALLAMDRADALLARDPKLAASRVHAMASEIRIALEREEKDRRLVAQIQEIRLQRATTDVRESKFDDKGTLVAYQDAFLAYGLDLNELDTDQAVALVSSRPPYIRDQFLAGLDDSVILKAQRDKKWLSAARLLDPDPWRNQLRAAYERSDREALERLAAEVDVGAQTACTIHLLARMLTGVQGESGAIELLKRAQKCYPDDLWINHDLGQLLSGKQPPDVESVRFLTVALALRPRSAGILSTLR